MVTKESGRSVTVDSDELKRLIEEAVQQAFSHVGILSGDDAAVDHRRRDFQFLHDLRQSTEGAKAKAGAFFLISVAGGMVAMLVSGFRLWVLKSP